MLAGPAGLMESAARAQDAESVAAVDAQPPEPAPRASAPAVRRKAAQKPAGQYFIEFRSRHALSYGHTFAVHGRLNARGEFADIEVAGLHPSGESSVPWTIGHVVPVPAETGASDGDLEDEYITGRYRVVLSEAQYATVAAFIKQLKASSPVWHAALYNCNAFVATIAQSMGMQTPFTWLPPAEFIASLREMNAHKYAAAPMPPLVPGHVAATASDYTATTAAHTSEQAAASPPPGTSTDLVLLPFER